MTKLKFHRMLIALWMAFVATAGAALENYNMAPAGTATQSSTGFGGDAPRANDGNTNGVYTAGSVQHSGTNAAGNWWQVDLGEIKFIDTIRGWNRTDVCCVARTTNFYFFVSDVPFTGTTIASSLAQSGVSTYHTTGTMGRPTTVAIGRTGRYVRLQLASANWLQVAEVEVIGDDPDPKIDVVKTADVAAGVVLGQTITYTYKVTNTGNVPFSTVGLADAHGGFGTPPVPLGETLTTDVSPTGDSTDITPNNGVWTKIGPGDVVTFTGTYVVVQQDIDELQN